MHTSNLTIYVQSRLSSCTFLVAKNIWVLLLERGVGGGATSLLFISGTFSLITVKAPHNFFKVCMLFFTNRSLWLKIQHLKPSQVQVTRNKFPNKDSVELEPMTLHVKLVTITTKPMCQLMHRCLDLSSSRNKMAVVDDNSVVHIYSLLTKELLWKHNNANSVAWNSEFEDMFCFSGGGMLSTKTADFPLHQQKLQGFVVGFKAAKIFCLHYISMQTLDIPQSASLQRYLSEPDIEIAYKV